MFYYILTFIENYINVFTIIYRYKATQLPGDLVFIPGGCPHAVRNLDDIHGLSMNYVDSSNYYLHLWVRLLEFDFRDFEL